MPPDDDIPAEFLDLAKSLHIKPRVTKREFVDLCKLAVSCIEAGQTTLWSRSNMAYYIANLWFRHDNIDDLSITSEIGGQFADWDIPGTFIIDDDAHRPYWEALKSWIKEADETYQ